MTDGAEGCECGGGSVYRVGSDDSSQLVGVLAVWRYICGGGDRQLVFHASMYREC